MDTVKNTNNPTEIFNRFKEIGSAFAALMHQHSLRGSLDISSDGQFTFNIFTDADYSGTAEIARSFGLAERAKQVFNETNPWFIVRGKIDGVEVRFFGKGLPPTCRQETYVEKVPKTQVTTLDGEYVEVTRTRVVCSEAEEIEAKL